jgi:alanine racemase
MSTEPVIRPTRVEIDLSAIQANVGLAVRLAGMAKIMAVVKADAYGHGAVPVARAALSAGAAWLGVAIPEEGTQLRQAGLSCPILVLGPISPDQAHLSAEQNLDQCVSDPGQIESLNRAGQACGRAVAVHLKIDTGMGRVGIPPAEAERVATRIDASSHLRLAGLMTHLAEADSKDPGFTAEQVARFRAVADAIGATLGVRPLLHAANSAGVLYHPDARLDLVRPGIMLYGCPPRRTPQPEDPPLRPPLRFRTAVSQAKTVLAGTSLSYGRTFITERPTRVATLPVGYADGLWRSLSNAGVVLIRGRRVPIVGRVCMDMTLVDVTDLPAIGPGEEAVLIGRQGGAAITADEVAGQLGTISYEVLCRIGPRVPRVYLPRLDPVSCL